jgi:hypothetical protein
LYERRTFWKKLAEFCQPKDNWIKPQSVQKWWKKLMLTPGVQKSERIKFYYYSSRTQIFKKKKNKNETYLQLSPQTLRKKQISQLITLQKIVPKKICFYFFIFVRWITFSKCTNNWRLVELIKSYDEFKIFSWHVLTKIGGNYKYYSKTKNRTHLGGA